MICSKKKKNSHKNQYKKRLKGVMKNKTKHNFIWNWYIKNIKSYLFNAFFFFTFPRFLCIWLFFEIPLFPCSLRFATQTCNFLIIRETFWGFFYVVWISTWIKFGCYNFLRAYRYFQFDKTRFHSILNLFSRSQKAKFYNR